MPRADQTPLGTRRLCEFCTDPQRDRQLAVTRIPGGAREWACQGHAEAFWRGLVTTAGALHQIHDDGEIDDERMDELIAAIACAGPSPGTELE